ncbi:TetR/AcrR family transcriptional regulator [Paraburkholderia silvatlantica]|uniref:TetR family transcriptional regulator n=1 Tax=Paraburkholderia silvatlantica TaxID=321895 RepID=A0A2V4SZU4_9BURK|nr:TetR/AcrR family transcriptional regulator [Paraburkholderia silvatlantica]PYE14846.1 TetR family transcriptional regulator [Paraburkholderia silvatlantica]TDR04838.1 TetR family transcriptional regulator [Paraburkholderia silvatlantica]
MKVTKAQATENREAIEKAAAALVRERGFDQTSVGAVAAAAGLTHGALYSHYGSKEALATAAANRAFQDTLEAFTGLSATEFFQRYLSAAHRDSPQFGCPNAALVSEVWRQPVATREAFRDGVKRYVQLIAKLLEPEDEAQDRATAVTMLAAMVGAVALSRGIRDVDLEYSDEILNDVSIELMRFTEEREPAGGNDSSRATDARAGSSVSERQVSKAKRGARAASSRRK